MTDILQERLDNCWAMLEEEGFYVKANTVELAQHHILKQNRRIEELWAALLAEQRISEDYRDMLKGIARNIDKMLKPIEGSE